MGFNRSEIRNKATNISVVDRKVIIINRLALKGLKGDGFVKSFGLVKHHKSIRSPTTSLNWEAISNIVLPKNIISLMASVTSPSSG